MVISSLPGYIHCGMSSAFVMSMECSFVHHFQKTMSMTVFFFTSHQKAFYVYPQFCRLLRNLSLVHVDIPRRYTQLCADKYHHFSSLAPLVGPFHQGFLCRAPLKICDISTETHGKSKTSSRKS